MSIRAVTSVKTGTFSFMAPKKKKPTVVDTDVEPKTKVVSCGYLYFKLSQWLTVERTIGIIVGITLTSLIIYLIIYFSIPKQEIEIYWSSTMSPSAYTCIQKFSPTLPPPFHPIFHYILASGTTSCPTFTSRGADNPQMYALYWLVDDFMHKFENIDLVEKHKDDEKLELLCKQYVQRYVLIVLNFATGGRDWVESEFWLSSKHECEWGRVECVKDGVVGLDLYKNNLVGGVPSEIFKLERLEKLVLASNELTGSVPLALDAKTSLRKFFLFFTRDLMMYVCQVNY